MAITKTTNGLVSSTGLKTGPCTQVNTAGTFRVGIDAMERDSLWGVGRRFLNRLASARANGFVVATRSGASSRLGAPRHRAARHFGNPTVNFFSGFSVSSLFVDHRLDR